MVGDGNRGGGRSKLRSKSRSNSSMRRLLPRPLLQFSALLLVSRLCSFSNLDRKESFAPVVFNNAFPIMVESWTTGSLVSHHPRRFSTTTTTKQYFPRDPGFQTTARAITPFFAISSLAGEAFHGSNSSATLQTAESSPMAAASTTTVPLSNNKASKRVQIHRLESVRRVHCISDLHVDNTDNMKWLESRCRPLPSTTTTTTMTTTNATANAPRLDWDETDLVVVAGDISHEMNKIERSLGLLQQTGAHVVFVPGNHEAWLSKTQKEDYDTAIENSGDSHNDNNCYSSVSKLEEIEALCRELGVYTTGDCLCIGGKATETKSNERKHEEEMWVLPLDSWYDGSLSIVDLNHKTNKDSMSSTKPSSHSNKKYDLVSDFGKWPWVDFMQCRWPSNHFTTGTLDLLRKIPTGLVDYYLKRNQPVIDAFHNATRSEASNHQKRVSVMTVTHFLPNLQSLPDWKVLESAKFDFDSWLDHGAGGTSSKFALVGGSSKIDDQIRSLSLVPNNHTAAAANSSSINAGGFYRQIHVFGHSHRPKDFVYRGIRYVHNPLGKPREREIHMIDPQVDTKLLWDAAMDDENCPQTTETILRYWEEKGGGLEMLRKRLESKKRTRELFFQKRKLRKQQQQQQQGEQHKTS